MGSMLINEQQFIEDNIFRYEDRLNSQYVRFLDKAPVSVTWYNINNMESTTDEGFQDIEAYISASSPLRFNKIKDLPVYGIDPIVLQLNDDEQGLDATYEGELIILPGTIVPEDNDLFTIDHVSDKTIIFRVKEIFYDTIRADGYYKVAYKLEYIDHDKAEQLEVQTVDDYSCVLSNIGTNEKCVIKHEYLQKIRYINDMYTEITDLYKAMFFSEKYNIFLGNSVTGRKLYDPLMTVFVNKSGIFNDKSDYSTIMLSEQFSDNERPLKYENSVYKFMEKRKMSSIKPFFYMFIPGTNHIGSGFQRWHDGTVDVVVPMTAKTAYGYQIFSDELITMMNAELDTGLNEYQILIKKFIKNKETGLEDIPATLSELVFNMSPNEEMFFFTPIILYIVRTIVEKFLQEKK